jgi:hypothetical protein
MAFFTAYFPTAWGKPAADWRFERAGRLSFQQRTPFKEAIFRVRNGDRFK